MIYVYDALLLEGAEKQRCTPFMIKSGFTESGCNVHITSSSEDLCSPFITLYLLQNCNKCPSGESRISQMEKGGGAIPKGMREPPILAIPSMKHEQHKIE